MTIDDAGIAFIVGFENRILHVYKDIAGNPTIGIGHLIKPGEDFSAGITEAQADQLLWSDLAPVEVAIRRLAPQCNQHQFNALCSFAFNLGVGSLETMLSHGFQLVPLQMPLWCHAGGKVVPGLQWRRKAEAELFASPQATGQ